MDNLVFLSPGWLTAAQAAQRMSVSLDYLYRLTQLGVFTPGARVGRATLYRESDVEEYITAHPRLGKRRSAAG